MKLRKPFLPPGPNTRRPPVSICSLCASAPHAPSTTPPPHQALQYMQFHAETQLEMTQDQMERLRLSVSRAGPLQDALDNCYR